MRCMSRIKIKWWREAGRAYLEKAGLLALNTHEIGGRPLLQTLLPPGSPVGRAGGMDGSGVGEREDAVVSMYPGAIMSGERESSYNPTSSAIMDAGSPVSTCC